MPCNRVWIGGLEQRLEDCLAWRQGVEGRPEGGLGLANDAGEDEGLGDADQDRDSDAERRGAAAGAALAAADTRFLGDPGPGVRTG